MKEENIRAAHLAAKANSLIMRIENSVVADPREGFEENLCGDYYSATKFQQVLDLMKGAKGIDAGDGNTPYVLAEYYKWGGRLSEAEKSTNVSGQLPGL